jgi:hypothetical protein
MYEMLQIVFDVCHLDRTGIVESLSPFHILLCLCLYAYLAVCFGISTGYEHSESIKWTQLAIKSSGCWTGDSSVRLCFI